MSRLKTLMDKVIEHSETGYRAIAVTALPYVWRLPPIPLKYKVLRCAYFIDTEASLNE